MSVYMARVAKLKHTELSLAIKLLFGPLIDAPPANPDTILTTLPYIEKSMKKNTTSTSTHVCADMQLYKI